MKSSAYATRGYYDALAQAEHRARSAEERLATIERMLGDGRPDDEIRAVLRPARSLRQRLPSRRLADDLAHRATGTVRWRS
jgi:hypothetical protein